MATLKVYVIQNEKGQLLLDSFRISQRNCMKDFISQIETNQNWFDYKNAGWNCIRVELKPILTDYQKRHKNKKRIKKI